MRPLTFNTGYSITDYDNLIASRQIVRAEAFTIDLADAGFADPDRTFWYTDAQASFTAPPCDGSIPLATYVANQVLISGFRFKAAAAAQKAGADPNIQLEVDEQTVTFTPQSGATINSLPWMQAVAAGALDGATIRRDRWFFATPGGTPICGMPMFRGVAASIDKLSRTQVDMKVKAETILLDINMPRLTYQPSCNYTVYDADCGLNPASFAATGTAASGSTRTTINWASATSVYTIGKLIFQSGPNVGISRTVRVATGTQLLLAYPLPNDPIAGDQFAIYQGCDRSYARCTALGNQAKFRGYDKIPPAETAF